MTLVETIRQYETSHRQTIRRMSIGIGTVLGLSTLVYLDNHLQSTMDDSEISSFSVNSAYSFELDHVSRNEWQRLKTAGKELYPSLMQNESLIFQPTGSFFGSYLVQFTVRGPHGEYPGVMFGKITDAAGIETVGTHLMVF